MYSLFEIILKCGRAVSSHNMMPSIMAFSKISDAGRDLFWRLDFDELTSPHLLADCSSQLSNLVNRYRYCTSNTALLCL